MQHDNLMLLPKPNRIRTETRTSEQNTHIIEIYEALEQPTDWSDELHLINTASEMDTIVLDICTPGGCGDTAFLFNRALRSTQAHTIAIIGPQCSSAGSVLALSCREWVLDETSEMMLHTSQYGMIGKEVDVYEHVTFSRKRLEKLFNIAYKGFLSDDEIKMLIAGTPMYFDSEDLAERLDNLVAYREDLEECEFGDSGIDDTEEPFNLKALIKEAVAEALAEKDGINQEAYLEWVEAVKEANKKEKPKRPSRAKKPEVKSLPEILQDTREKANEIFKDIVEPGSTVELDC